ERLHGAGLIVDAIDRDELLAAESVEQIPRPKRLPQELRKAHQDLVAVEMAEIVVDALEVIDVEDGEEPRAAGRRPASQAGIELGLECAPVAKPRERVGLRIDEPIEITRRNSGEGGEALHLRIG